MPTHRAKTRVLVAGATGRLGALPRVLLERGHWVRALTRDPGSPAAAALRAAGAEVVYGNFGDPDSVVRAAAGVEVMFATGTAHQAGPQGELRHGLTIAQTAGAAGVPHLVYSSGDGAGPDSPLLLFKIKYQVEQRIRSLPIAHTILAPVYFMENLFNPWNLSALRAGIFPSPIPVDLPLQQVAIDDLATFAAVAIERPDEFAGQRVRIASAELSAARAASELSRVAGRRFAPEHFVSDQLAPGLRALFAWLEHPGHNVDLATLHRQYPEVGWHSYGAWLRPQRARLRQLCPREPASVT
jgi:uncharacterized protein YbjT (DUF2867 family)